MCGSTIYPCPPEHMGAYGLCRCSIGLCFGPRFGGILEKVQRDGKKRMGTNLFPLIGPALCLCGVMGKYEDRQPTKEELEEMSLGTAG